MGVNIGRLWPDDLSDRARRANDALASCRLCARACDVDRRTDAEAGYCRLDSRAWVYKELLSYGEEALISPTWLIDLSGCSLRCLFCTEWSQITETQQGRTLDPEWFAKRWRERVEQGARTVSFVGGEPTVSLPGVLRALTAIPREQQLPIIWNSNGLLSPQSYELLAPLVQTWIIDLKLSDDRWLGAGTLPYLDEVSRWLDRLHQDVTAQKDRLIIRHLVMPGQVESQTLPLLKRCAQRWPKATVNLMTQYLPFGPAMRAKDRSHPLRKIANADEIALAREALQTHPGAALVDGEIHSHRIDT